jgi:hypothetical protein
MFSRIRKRITFANVAMTLALVFVMTGGAYAAKKYLITSTNQIKPSVLAQLKGKNGTNGTNGVNGKDGAAGVQGPKGDAGEKGLKGDTGEKGAKGDPGTPGTPGKNVVTASFEGGKEPGTKPCKGAGGNELEVEGTGVKHYACNGEEGLQGTPGTSVTNSGLVAKNGSGHCEEGGAELKVGTGSPTYACNGSPWTVGGVLPSGQSEKGTWIASGEPATVPTVGVPADMTSVTFPIPLAVAPEVRVVPFQGKGGGAGTGCPTTSEATKPEAEPGHICIFITSLANASELEGGNVFSPEATSFGAGKEQAGKTGALLLVIKKINPITEEFEPGPLAAYGTWAVTAK